MPTFSTTLEQAIHGALALANARRHELATLEHLLLALIDEPDAARVMKACSVDLEILKKTLTAFIDDDLATLVTDVEGNEAVPTAAFQRVIQRAAIHVQSSGRTEVTGANVLVAIFAERESNAAFFLQEQDMTRYDAVNYIAHGVAKNPSFGEARPVSGADEPHETPKAEAGEAKESALSKYCVDLNDKAMKGDVDPLIGREAEVEAIFDKWDIHCALIGEVTAGPNVQYYWHGELIGDLPAEHLVLGGGAPVYHREWSEPAYYAEYQKFNVDSVPVPADLKSVAERVVALPNIASKRWIYEQYDSMVGTINRSTNDASDASIVNLRGTNRALAMTVDCNSRYVHADPEVGAMIAVAENARNITCSGGTPSAITNCLNFGNPYNPEVYWQFVGSIKGMGKACLKFETPVTGGNVSFYNQTAIGNKVEPVFPTPTIAMIGLVDDINHVTTLGFKSKGDLIFLIGSSRNDLASSQYLVHEHGITASPAPYFDLDEEYVVQRQVAELIRERVVASAHDVSEGGLFVTLLESAMAGGLGFDLTTDAEIRPDAFLFGEAQGRIVVSVRPEDEERFLDIMMRNGVEFDLLGHVTKGSVRVDDEEWGTVASFRDRYDNALNFSKKS